MLGSPGNTDGNRMAARALVLHGWKDPMAPPEQVLAFAEEIVRLLEVSRGRAFVLFTSYANMNAVAERIAGRVPYPVFIDHGQGP